MGVGVYPRRYEKRKKGGDDLNVADGSIPGPIKERENTRWNAGDLERKKALLAAAYLISASIFLPPS